MSRAIGNRATIAALGLGAAHPPAATLQRRGKWYEFWKWGRGGGQRAAAQANPAPAPPVAAVAAPAYTPYRTTTIKIKDAPTYPGPGTYVATVTQHLDDIRAIVGDPFFAALSAPAKAQPIFYTTGENYCRSTSISNVVLRQAQGNGDKTRFAASLNVTLTSLGLSAAQLVGQLRATPLPRWSGATDPAPIEPFEDAAATQTKVDDWIAGRELPSNDELDILLLIVEPAAEAGSPNGSGIGYDPQKLTTSTGARPPQVALFHELVHAYYNALGKQLGAEESTNEDAGGRLFELMAVGMGPFAGRPYSENALRHAWNPQVPPRTRYN